MERSFTSSWLQFTNKERGGTTWAQQHTWTTTEKKQPEKRKTAALSPGTLKIISATRGVLLPTDLRNFLNQVRGRKKAIEIASHFTTDMPGLVHQLRDVETSYYKKGKRCARMDKDIKFIQRLYKRLQRDIADDSHDRFDSDDRSDSYDRSDSDEDGPFEGCYNKDIYQTFKDDKTETVFASTSSYQQRVVQAKEKKPRAVGSLSSGTVNIIYNTVGRLPPEVLCDFLNEVRGRKIALQIARQFTSNIPSLVRQLQEVRESYQMQGKERSAAVKKEQSCVRRTRSLSSVTVNIISKTKGPLSPLQLRNFLNQVRGKKKATEIAGHFTRNISALVNQLQKVEDEYYKTGKKGSTVSKDMQFIQRLRMRLLRDRDGEYSGAGFSGNIRQVVEIREEYSEKERECSKGFTDDSECSTDDSECSTDDDSSSVSSRD